MTFRGIAPGDRAQTPPYTDAEMAEADSLERLSEAFDRAITKSVEQFAKAAMLAKTFREECAKAAGTMIEHSKEGGFFLVTATPHRATGELTLYPAEKGGEEHASLELHGLSRGQTLRVLAALKEEPCGCGAPGTPLHSCPFQEEVHNDSKPCCNCCDRCEQQCSDDI